MSARIRILPLGLVFIAALVIAAGAYGQTTWYVDDDASGDPGPGDPTVSDPDEDGSAAHPYDAIQEGIDAAIGGDTVLVLDGTYTGTGNKNLDYAGKAITVMSENGASACIIDCEGSGRGFLFDDGQTADAVVDGFTITNGNGSGGHGGAIKCYTSSPTITNCIVTGNTADRGAGVYAENCGPALTNCLITGNTANLAGGGVHSETTTLTVVNCTIAENDGTNGGGGVNVAAASDVAIANCVLWGNTSAQGSQLRILGSNASTVTVSYCDVEGGQAEIYVHSACTLNWGDGNIAADPLFADPNNADYHLDFGSPCIDAGTNDPPGGLPPDDLDGNVRPIDGDGDVEPWTGVAETADMGAYERPAPTTPVICFSPAEFTFAAPEGGPDPDDQTLSIWNCGVGTLNWEIVEDCSWLTVDPNSGDSIGEIDEVALSVDVTGLPPGEYVCDLDVVDPAASNSPRTVHVTLDVSLPEICLSPTTLTFFAPEGGPNPDDQTLSIWNCGVGTLNWEIVEDCSWLTVDPNSGDSIGEVDEVTLSVNVTGLAVGWHNCTAQVVDPGAGNSPQTFEVDVFVYPPGENALYVDDDAALGGDGLSWGTAFKYLQDALATIPGNPAITEIRIGGGVYTPDQDEAGNVTPGDRAAAFQLLNGITILGGYRGLAGGGDADDRDIAAFETILSGEIGDSDSYDNSYHVVTGGGTDSTAILDGVTVAYGFATNGTAKFHGAGINLDAGSPTLRDCVIRDNTTAYDCCYCCSTGGSGAGLYCDGGSPTLIRCVFRDNAAADGRMDWCDCGCPAYMGTEGPTAVVYTLSTLPPDW